MTRERPIALVGLMGAGKSTVARIVGRRLGGSVADLDAWVEEEAGCTVAEIFRREGEPGFRRREAACLSALLAAPPAVLACGGGAVIDPASRARLQSSCHVVWLEVSPEEAARRLNGTTDRPLLDQVGDLETLLRSRTPAYAEAATRRVMTDGRTPDEVAEEVLAVLSDGAEASSR